MTKMDRLERSSFVLIEALTNYIAAVAAELKDARATVAPHEHPESSETKLLRTQLVDGASAETLNRLMEEMIAKQGDLVLPEELPKPTMTLEQNELAAKALRNGTFPTPDPTPAASLAEYLGEKRITWTSDRLQVLRDDYTAGIGAREIFDRLSAMPGAPLSSYKSVAVMATQHGWRRPAKPEIPELPSAATPPAPPITKAIVESLSLGDASQGWTPQRIEFFRKAWAEGDSCSTIGKALGISASAVTGKRSRLGLPERPSVIIRKPSVVPVTCAPAAPSKAPGASGAAPAEIQAGLLAARERWTAERLAIAQPMYEAGKPIVEIAVAVNATPGPVVKIPQINLLAGVKGWKRGTPPAPAPIAANDGQIRQWAGERGIVVQGKDLPMGVINGRRAHLGLPPFELALAHRGRAI